MRVTFGVRIAQETAECEVCFGSVERGELGTFGLRKRLVVLGGDDHVLLYGNGFGRNPGAYNCGYMLGRQSLQFIGRNYRLGD